MKTNKDRLIHDLMVIPEYWLLREFWDGDQDEETEQPALTEHSCDCILRVVEKLTAEMQERKCPIRTCFEEDIAALTVIAGFKDAVAGTGYEDLCGAPQGHRGGSPQQWLFRKRIINQSRIFNPALIFLTCDVPAQASCPRQ